MNRSIERHPFDLLALVTGACFCIISAAALFHQAGWVSSNGRVWVGVAVLLIGVVSGGAVVASALRRR